jgi:hypothetical protein
MAGRPKQKKANIEALKKLDAAKTIIDVRPLIAYVMRHSGCTFTEIGEVFGLTRQQAQTKFEQAERIYINEKDTRSI